MKSFRSLLAPKEPAERTRPAVVDIHSITQRILIEYILNMAVTCVAKGDLAPLYEQYMEDPRLSDDDKDELARAYLLLQMSPIPPDDR